MGTTVSTATLTLTTAPTTSQLHAWWRAMHADPDDLKTSFSDFSSRTLQKFLCQDIVLVLCHLDEEVAAAGWLHDLARDAQDTVLEGWIGGWVAKPCRGRIGIACWELVLDYFVERGVAHIHSAVHYANRASFVFTKRMMGFTHVGRFPRFSQFGGVRTDVNILTLHAADRARAWQAAEALARRRWGGREVDELMQSTKRETCLLA
jgi:hypothetical protein